MAWINSKLIQTGRILKEDGNVVNQADILDSVHYIDEISTTTYPYLSLRQGRSYVAGKVFAAVDANEYAVLEFRNGTKNIYISYSVVSDGKCFYGVYANPVITASGTPVNIFKRNALYSVEPTATVFHTPTYTSLGTISVERINPTGSGPAKGGASAGDEMASVVPAGAVALIAVQNQSTTASDINIIVNWIEIEEV